jgi:HEAT repeat protein
LGYQGDPAAAQPLIALLPHSNKHVRQAAAMSLGRLDAHEARPALQRLLTDPEPHVREAAKEALQRIRD